MRIKLAIATIKTMAENQPAGPGIPSLTTTGPTLIPVSNYLGNISIEARVVTL